MLTMVAQNTRRSISAVMAMAMVAFMALAIDQGHVAAAPRGTVEVGQLTPVGLDRLAQATLPEIVVTAQRSVQFAGASGANYDGAQG